ncbi:hypothetical protein Bca101_040315 [Brassica carinata]
MEGKLIMLEATVAKLGASNERLKEKLNRKRKRSRSGSLFPQFVVKHRRRSAPMTPQNNDLPDHDQHVSPNSKKSQLNQNSPHRRSPNHFSPNHHSPDTNSPQNRSPNHCSPNHHSPTNQLPHLNSLAHDSLNTKSPNHRTESPSSPDHNSTEHTISLGDPSPNYHSSKHVSPANDSGLPSSPMITLSDHVFNTPISPTYRPPPHAALSPQVSHSQQFAPIATLPQFDATPLNQPTSQSSPAHSLTLTEPDTAPPPAGFSTHCSTPNAFAATAVLKGSTSTFSQTPRRLIDEEQKIDHGPGELSDSSPDKTVRMVVDELKAQTRYLDVCELSDSSPAKKNTPHSPSDDEKAHAEAFINRPDFPHYLLITPPPNDLWDIFSKTLSSKKNV